MTRKYHKWIDKVVSFLKEQYEKEEAAKKRRIERLGWKKRTLPITITDHAIARFHERFPNEPTITAEEIREDIKAGWFSVKKAREGRFKLHTKKRVYIITSGYTVLTIMTREDGPAEQTPEQTQ